MPDFVLDLKWVQNAAGIISGIIADCTLFLYDYFMTGLFAGAALAFLYSAVLVCRFFSLRRVSGRRAICCWWKVPFIALLGFYGHLVLAVTILSREKGAKYIWNLIPFSTWGTSSRHLTLWLENILMMAPLGILLYILWAPFRKPGWSMLAGFLCSLAIECIQLFGRLGKFELDDIMNNVFGMLIGLLLCKGAGILQQHILSFVQSRKGDIS